MISGTSNIWLKSGPVDFLTITKMAQKYKKLMVSSLRIIIFISENIKIWKFSKISKGMPTFCSENVFVCFREGNIFWKYFEYIFLKIFLWRWGSGIYKLSMKTFAKAWMLISYLSKTWNINLVNPPKLSIFK